MEWAHIAWIIVSSILMGATWIGKTIIEPWSTAYLEKCRAEAQTANAKSVAEIAHLKAIDEALVAMVLESRKQTPAIESIDEQMKQQNETLKKMDSDSQRLCKAAASCKADGLLAKMDEQIVELRTLAAQGVKAAQVSLERAEALRVELDLRAASDREELEERAKKERRDLKDRQVVASDLVKEAANVAESKVKQDAKDARG